MKYDEKVMREWVDKGLVTAPADDSPDLAPILFVTRVVGFPDPIPEYEFCPNRKFRFDLAWPDYLVAFEREGGTFTAVTCSCGKKRTVFVSRHHSRDGLEEDAIKYNLAATANWLVIRATPGMIKSGQAAAHLCAALRLREPSSRKG
jgi:hypothetical protein